MIVNSYQAGHSARFFNSVKKAGKLEEIRPCMTVGELCGRFLILLTRHTCIHASESESDSSNSLRTGDEMGAVFAQQKKCPLNAVVRAAGFFAGGEKEGKRDTPWTAVGERSSSELDSSNKLRAAGFFAGGEKEGKRDTLNV